ncbi:MAG: NAD-binding protein [Polyangiaceae bacterium]|nr:NAD-binding protein [Polyangiaceae bacterium]
MRRTLMPTQLVSARTTKKAWRRFWWRALVLALVFAAGLLAFTAGATVSDRPYLGQSTPLVAKVYYTIGLFVLGGMDLGVPNGGPKWAQALLWFAYFAAPAITAGAVIEGIIRLVDPNAWSLKRLEGHIVIAGTGELSMVYLKRLRAEGVELPVVVVELKADHPNFDLFAEAFGARVVVGNIATDALLTTLNLEHAERILLLTGDDFTNLNAASKIIHLYPKLGRKILLHVSDLAFMRAVARTRVGQECEVFNTHQLAASHLVHTDVLRHFQRTEHYDTVVLAGFGRFGQTVLDELQKTMPGEFDRVIIVDLTAKRHAMTFDAEVGFSDKYSHVVINGDLRDPEVWSELLASAGQAPLILLSSSDDGANLHTALWITAKLPKAYVIARSFGHSAFAEEVAREQGFTSFSVADLVSESIPPTWLCK